jgi:hypothetical protein
MTRNRALPTLQGERIGFLRRENSYFGKIRFLAAERAVTGVIGQFAPAAFGTFRIGTIIESDVLTAIPTEYRAFNMILKTALF